MKQTKKITILHSNDLHGDFLAEQLDEIERLTSVIAIHAAYSNSTF